MTNARIFAASICALAALLAAPRAAHAQQIRVLLVAHQLQTVIASEGGLVLRGVDSGPAPLLQPEITTVVDVRPGAGGLVLAGAVPAGSSVVVEPLLNNPLVV
ncbi:MAG TPA: hypothetical protein VFF60_12010, partial [Candidatus Binatus sp.]|nr:hypothetical protein [Candidatus Binatus sp.]